MIRALLTSHALLRGLAWLALYAVILGGGWSGYYISQRHTPLLYAALLLLALSLAALGSERLQRARSSVAAGRPAAAFKLSELPETLLHCVPLLLFIAVGPTTISATHAAPIARLAPPGAQRSMAPEPAKEELNFEDDPEYQAWLEALGEHDPLAGLELPAESATDGKPQASGGYMQATIIDLPFWDSGAWGDQVEVTGIYHRTAEGDWASGLEGVGSGRDILYRYMITCCVVDASAVMLLLDELPNADLEPESWVTLRGTFTGMSPGGWSLPIVKVHSIEPAETPQYPYLMY